MKIKIKKRLFYDEFVGYIEPGVYDYEKNGDNGWSMIRVNCEWLDITLEDLGEDYYEIMA